MNDIEALLQEAEQQRREVKLNGKTLLVRELTMSEFAHYGEAMGTKSGDAQRTEALARIFSTAVIKPDGTPAMNMEQARKIAGVARLAAPIISAILEAGGLGADDAKEGAAKKG